MRKLKLFLAVLSLVVGGNLANAQTDVTTSYIGDVARIVNGGGHSHNSDNHKESNGIGWWNTQSLSGWHAFAAPNATGGAGESWSSGFGSAGVMMGRTMVLPEGNYTLSFEAFGCNATNSVEPGTLPSAGDVVAFLTGESNVDITNTAAAGDATFHNVSFTFDVTTANTAYEFGIKKLTDGSKIDWCQIKNVKLTLNSDNVFPVVNNDVSVFAYSGNQTWHTNTWSTEGQGDGSRFQVPFHELWVASGGKLNDATIKASFTPSQSGVYKVSAWVRAMNEAGGTVTGAKIFVADVDADACTGSVVYNGKGRLGTYTAMADGVADTPFEYGFKLENAEINWLAFKNVTITYLGTMPQSEINALLAQVPTGKINADIESELNGLVSAFQSNASVANYNALSLYLPTAQASANVYANINTAITSYAAKAAALDAAGQAAYDASGIQSKYDNGTYITFAEAEAELNTALANAVKAQTTVDSDWTGIIVNPSFETGNTNGWTSSGIGTQNNGAFTLTDGTYYAEAWQPNGVKSVKQTINAMPAGVYKLSANCKARGVTSAKIYAGGIEKAITIDDSQATYAVEFACDANANIEIGFEGEGTGASNSWLCVDNFQLTLVSAGLPDVTAVTGNMNAAVAQAQDNAIAAYNANKTVDNYNAASAAIAAAQTSVTAYTAANAAITKAEGIIAETNIYTTDAYNTYNNAIGAAKDAYNNGTMADADASALETNLNGGTDWQHSGDPMRPFYTSAWTASNGVSIYTNNWSNEGAGDGSNFLTPFIEDYVGNSNTLANTEISASIPNLDKGTYQVTARVRMRLNDNGTEPLSGLSLKASYGNATAVSGNKNYGAFYVADVTAEGYVTEDNGTLKIEFVVDGTNASWISIKAVNYVKTSSTINAPLADAADYAALNAVLDPVKDNVAGFETGEYAPYNNKDAFAALANAKAINQSGDNLKGWVEEVKDALSTVTWTANTEELNAFYDGDFSECAEDNSSPLDYTPAGWTPSGNMRMMLKSSETYPGVADASATTAMMSWSGGITYGEQPGYEIPLKPNAVYTLKLKAAGWNNETRSGISVSILNGTDGMALYNLGTSDRDIKGNANNTAGMTSYEYAFATGAAGNYVFHIQSDNNMVITDFEIKKAASQYLEFADGSVPTYAPGTYPTVKISRSLKAGKWATAIYPFEVSGVDGLTIANLNSYNGGTLDFSTATASEANKPFLMKADADKAEISVSNVAVAAAAATDVTAGDASLKGVYAETPITNAETNYVMSSNTLYPVGTAGATIPAYRAYIQLAEAAPARLSFAIDGQETTGIEGISVVESENGVVYNLQGQRVMSAQKGLYIKDGKKVVRK